MLRQIKNTCIIVIVVSVLLVVLLQGVLPRFVTYSLEAKALIDCVSCSAVAFAVLSGLCLLLRYIAMHLEKEK